MSDWDADSPVSAEARTDVDAAVEAAMAGIAELDDVPLDGHVARFDAVHRTLADALSAIDGN